MKNLIYLFLVFSIFACTAKKTVQKSDTEQKIEQHNDITDMKASQVEAEKTVDDNSCTDDEDVINTTKYDTSKPNDPVTGKPPISEESTITHKTHKKANVKTKVNVAKKDESSHKDNSEANAQSKEESKIVDTSKPINWKFYIISSLIIAALIIGFVFRKKIKSFFPFLP